MSAIFFNLETKNSNDKLMTTANNWFDQIKNHPEYPLHKQFEDKSLSEFLEYVGLK